MCLWKEYLFIFTYLFSLLFLLFIFQKLYLFLLLKNISKNCIAQNMIKVHLYTTEVLQFLKDFLASILFYIHYRWWKHFFSTKNMRYRVHPYTHLPEKNLPEFREVYFLTEMNRNALLRWQPIFLFFFAGGTLSMAIEDTSSISQSRQFPPFFCTCSSLL